LAAGLAFRVLALPFAVTRAMVLETSMTLQPEQLCLVLAAVQSVLGVCGSRNRSGLSHTFRHRAIKPLQSGMSSYVGRGAWWRAFGFGRQQRAHL
jgi:hypothetical protein